MVQPVQRLSFAIDDWKTCELVRKIPKLPAFIDCTCPRCHRTRQGFKGSVIFGAIIFVALLELYLESEATWRLAALKTGDGTYCVAFVVSRTRFTFYVCYALGTGVALDDGVCVGGDIFSQCCRPNKLCCKSR